MIEIGERLCRACDQRLPTDAFPILGSGRRSLRCGACRWSPPIPAGERACRRCGRTRPASRFRANAKGPTSVCDDCRMAKAQATRARRVARLAVLRAVDRRLVESFLVALDHHRSLGL